jgi:hypothetical protein
VSTQAALKSLFELRAVLDRMGENDSTLREAIGHDIERAIRLTNAAVAQLTQGERGAADPADGPDTDDEEDE